MALSEEALQAYREYKQKWRDRNKQHIHEYNKHWRDTHQENTRRYRETYWERKAQAFNEWNNSSLSTSKFSIKFKDAAVELELEKKRTKHGMIWQGVGIDTSERSK